MFDQADVQQLVDAFLTLEDADDVRAFLTDLCTPREICDFAQRLQVARYLDGGDPYVEVQARTGASSGAVTVASSSNSPTARSRGCSRIVSNKAPCLQA